jgi:hypothetical protein
MENAPMQPTPTTGAHPEDGVLLRLLDGEADAAEQAAGAHAAGCAECRARMDAMVRRRDRLNALLARTDFPVPAASAPEPGVIPLHARRREAAPARPWLRAAAIILVVLGVGVMASPARAWIARWITEAWESVAGDGDAPPAPAPAPTPAPEPAEQTAAAQVGFVPTGAELTVVVAHAQDAGALTVAAAQGESATAEVVGGTGSADLLVLPAALHVRNVPGSAAEYRLTLPSSVRRVRVRVGGGRETVVNMAEVGDSGRRVELSGGG